MPTGQHQTVKTHCPKGHPYSGDNLVVAKQGKGKKGFHRQCRTCLRERAKAYYWRTREERLTYNKERRRKRSKEQRREEHLRRVHGISLADYEALVEAQGGVCAGCGQPPPGTGKHPDLVVDHCHDRGKIRGLLCQSCNIALGRMRENPAALRGLADYIERG